jgi:5'-3' exonuclease
MDCNSIIYDIVRGLSFEEFASSEFYEKVVIDNVINKIEFFIDMISPSKSVYIAFDGVAPLAKMEQQRSRRYKNVNVNTSGWSTANITPGTIFMKSLSERVHAHFKNDSSGIDIIVSSSNEPGEGEHKIFRHIRNQDIEPHDTGFVYGLDSDLIMLSIFHCSKFKEFYIFRETPEFAKSLNSISSIENESKSCCFMDIVKLSKSILLEMRCEFSEESRIYDYVMLCFFLGNDFLPHFPSLNIRTHGMQILMDTYRNNIGNKADRGFISQIDNKIQWKWLHLFISELSKNEHEYILQEYETRKKWDKRTWKTEIESDRDFTLQSVPVIYRGDEIYICPSEKGWESRYYKSLFHKSTANCVDRICKNYLEGLEWVFKYYTVDCPDWKWKYEYHYPPLLKDLVVRVPASDFTFIAENRESVTSSVQMAYVFPRAYHGMMSSKNRGILQSDKYSHLYPTEYDYKWTFCRYLWESHVDLPFISNETLQEWTEVLEN